MIELSTLTGACVVALGEKSAGIFTNKEEFALEIKKIGHENYEKFWHLPIQL